MNTLFRIFAIVFFLSFPFTKQTLAQSTTVSGSANFGNVSSNAQTNVCIQAPYSNGSWYPPDGSSASISTPGGNVSITTTNQLQPGQNCLPAQFTQGSSDGAITGSTNIRYCNTSTGCGSTMLYVNVSATGQSTITQAQAAPAYQILSILYTPPGDHSNSGFSNSTSAGVSNSFAQNYSNANSISFSGGLLGTSSGVSFSTANTQGDTTGFTVSYQGTSGSQLSTAQQTIDHNQDQVYLWINPSIKVQQTGSTTGYFSLGTVDVNGNYNTGAPMDIVNVNIAGLKTPSLIPLNVLQAQNPQPGVTLPGLSVICANRVPDNQCTQQNACGCVPSDFAGIVAEDPLSSNPNQATQPNSIDSSRYVYVNYLPLEGPQQQGAGPVSNSFSLSDSQMGSQSYSNGSSYSVGLSKSYSISGPFSLGITQTKTFTYGETKTAGTTNGTAHTGSVTLGTSRVGCQEYVDVYEDTLFHTFAYALSQPPPAPCQ